jgi:hypothetical protein
MGRKTKDDFYMNDVYIKVAITVACLLVLFGLYTWYRHYSHVEKMKEIAAPAFTAISLNERELATVSQAQAWKEIEPLATREGWFTAVAKAKAIMDAAREKGACSSHEKDYDTCRGVADTVDDEMQGLNDHLRLVRKSSGEQAVLRQSLEKDRAESIRLLQEAKHLALTESRDQKLLAKLEGDVSTIGTYDLNRFDQLFDASLAAANCRERLTWLVNRVRNTAKAQADQWYVKVLASTPSYRVTLWRTTWDNYYDSPTLTEVSRTVDVSSSDSFETLKNWNGKKIGDWRPGGIRLISPLYAMDRELELADLQAMPRPNSDNEGEVYLDGCEETVIADLEIHYDGKTVRKISAIPKADLKSHYPLLAGVVFTLKEANQPVDQIQVPLWFSPIWTTVYNSL